jgi:peptide/nickel transport system permease protein
MAKGIAFLFPGLHQVRSGRWLGGGTALTLWVGLLVLSVARFDRVLGSASDGLDGWIALLTLLLVLGGVWSWSVRDVMRGGAGVRGSQGAWGRLWRTFRRNRLAVFGLWVVGAFYLAALLTPFLAPFNPTFQPAYQAGETGLIMAPPSLVHILGTDQLSRDIFSRLLYGSRISLSIGLLAVGISVTLGALLGAVAGYMGGWVDGLMMRLVDIVMAFPRLVLLIALVAFFDSSIFLIIMALALTQWPFTTRVVRGEVLGLREREFAEAAKALGFSRFRIIFRHLLPNAMAPVIVAATLGIGNTIILEAGLSFLGLGVRPPTPSWGIMVATGRSYLSGAWWIATFPGLVIALVVLAFNLVGDGLRDALDPRQAREVGG